MNRQETLAITDAVHVHGPPRSHQQNHQNSELGERRMDGRAPPDGRAQQRCPTPGHRAHLRTRPGPVGVNHSIPSLPCREKRWRVLTGTPGCRRAREACETEYVSGLQTTSLQGPSPPKTAERGRQGGDRENRGGGAQGQPPSQ